MKDTGAVHVACEWCYRGVWAVLTSWFCLPRQPNQIEFGDGHSVVVMRPSEAYLSYRKFQFWIGLVLIDVILIGLWIATIVVAPWIGILTAPLWIVVIVLPDILAYVAIHLRYDTTWYALSDRSLRIRRGIWTIHETTITFANIQNVNVSQGPLQRWFGFSNLIVSTAGGGGSEAAVAMGGHVGLLEGLENAQALKDQILRHSQINAGLGDEEVEVDPVWGGEGVPISGKGAWDRELFRALQDVRDAAKRCKERMVGS
ncbi:Bacterial membrane flanked domain protein [Pirellula sp. SH-Sr6A]|uniref:PH domain-containing protein n=1 Tax=Pirellula sp. SH-Sr6A TaxID=1632865 RepID=UPI00078E4C37|nr:PH domain-containing protein [Pirellula sp. SH-Sr6A]AMV32114.1 Bacterial membrane flanked domain protein [Pirellula sp. SH-Sr6A]